MAENTCCGALELFANEYPGSLQEAVQFSFSQDSAQLNPLWVIKGYKLTPTGRVSMKDAQNLVITYCPFCGQKIREEESDASS